MLVKTDYVNVLVDTT